MKQQKERSEQEVRENMAYNKRIIRHAEVMFIILFVIAAVFFGIIAWNNGILNVLSLTLTIFAMVRVWKIGDDYEVSNWMDEWYLTHLTNKKQDDE
jgi:uncharacterized membrane protein